MSSDSNYYVGFLVDDISELGHTIKSLCSWHKKVLAQSRHGQKYSPSSHRKPHANLMRLCSINCLEMPSDSRNYFVYEFFELVYTIKSLGSRHWGNVCDKTAGIRRIFLTAGHVVYHREIVPGSRITNVRVWRTEQFYGLHKLGKFVHLKTRIISRIGWHF